MRRRPPTPTLFPYTTLFRSRHLKAMLGVTAGEFRRRFPFDVSLERYVDLLITPYRETLRAFCPLNAGLRSEEHTSELQSHSDLVCRLLLEKKKNAQWPQLST